MRFMQSTRSPRSRCLEQSAEWTAILQRDEGHKRHESSRQKAVAWVPADAGMYSQFGLRKLSVTTIHRRQIHGGGYLVERGEKFLSGPDFAS